MAVSAPEDGKVFAAEHNSEPDISTAPEICDLRGLTCPLPVLRARKRLAGMKSGACLWVDTTDPLAVIDIPAFCRESGHRLIESFAVEGGHRFLIERGADAQAL